AKEIFKEDNSLIFQKKLKDTLTQNRAYMLKPYDYCKKHPDCYCDFFDINHQCNKCDLTCERKIATWGRGTLPKKIIGPFEFGKFREIEKKYTKKRKLDINELKANEYL
ncbi:33970_t:CDS:1, partial [Racocetra persica]